MKVQMNEMSEGMIDYSVCRYYLNLSEIFETEMKNVLICEISTLHIKI